MVLIFGGAYQGKLDYAKITYHLKEEDIFHCGNLCDSVQEGTDKPAEIDKLEKTDNPKIDFNKRCVYNLEYFILACVKEQKEANDYLKTHASKWQNKIIICTDISQGIVPIEKDMRAWREMTGRTMNYLADQAETVIRIFCGLPQTLKERKETEHA